MEQCLIQTDLLTYSPTPNLEMLSHLKIYIKFQSFSEKNKTNSGVEIRNKLYCKIILMIETSINRDIKLNLLYFEEFNGVHCSMVINFQNYQNEFELRYCNNLSTPLAIFDTRAFYLTYW